MQDPYLYTETEVLINLFDERNENRLKEIEANYTSLRLRQLFENPIKGKFGFAHLCKMHRFIFQDKKVLCDFSNINWQSKNVKSLSKNFAKNMALLWNEENSLYVRNALVAANAIFKDIGDKSNYEYLQRIVFDAMNV